MLKIECLSYSKHPIFILVFFNDNDSFVFIFYNLINLMFVLIVDYLLVYSYW